LRGNFVFRPPDTTLRSNVTAGRYIQILQSRDTYEHLAAEMVKGGAVNLAPVYNINDPLISQLVSAIANEIESGFSTGFWLTPSIRRSRSRLYGYAVIPERSHLRRRTAFTERCSLNFPRFSGDERLARRQCVCKGRRAARLAAYQVKTRITRRESDPVLRRSPGEKRKSGGSGRRTRPPARSEREADWSVASGSSRDRAVVA